MSDLKIKVCGMRDANNIIELQELNPDFMGFIFYPPSKRYVGKTWDSTVAQSISDKIKTVAVFVNESTEDMEKEAVQHKFSAVQLHGNETPEQCVVLKKKGFIVFKAFQVHSGFDFRITEEYEDGADYLLFDTKTNQHGGSGKKFDWRILEKYKGKTPFFLSGGIAPEDVFDVLKINHEKMAGLDINSRFETAPGEKEVQKIRQFMDKIRKA